MKESQYPVAVLTGLLIGVCFLIGTRAMRVLMGAERSAASQERLAPSDDEDAATALACAALHPDAEIGETLVKRVRSGRVALRVKDLHETLYGTFHAYDGRPMITLSRALLPASTTRDACEPLLATLTHEYVHYEQWLRDGSEWVHAVDERLDEGRCVRFVMQEIEAYGRTCLVGERYGWPSAIAQCGVLDMSARAKNEIAFNGASRPECVDAWKTLARGRHVPPTRREKAQRTRRPPSTDREGPIYMPPP